MKPSSRYASKILCTLSIIFAIGMVSGAGWTFGSRLTKLGTETSENSTHSNIQPQPPQLFNASNTNANNIWRPSRPIVIACCIFAMLVGSLQTLVSALVLTSSYEKLQFRMRVWIAIHLVVWFAIAACLSLAFYSIHDPQYTGKWTNSINNFDSYIDSVSVTVTPTESEFNFIRFMKSSSLTVFYTAVAANFGAIASLMVISFCVVNSSKPSKQYELY